MINTLTSPVLELLDTPLSRLSITVRGVVQGVGFRPFIYRLASDAQLAGWVNNNSQGVQIEVEGSLERLQQFLARIEAEKPPRASIQSLEARSLDPVGYSTFEVRESDHSAGKTALILPDCAICADCLREIFDPSNRRYRYPFTNCTNCGPRYSIIEALPYDRAATTMRGFTMCPECQAEYDNPLDRRFHAQPNACPRCGPYIELWDAAGRRRAVGTDALNEAADAIRCGQIVAVKGLGGFHLVVDARDDHAVLRLRRRKEREEKPFALMFPHLAAVRSECIVGPLEERLLRSPEAPIVILRRSLDNDHSCIASAVAPGNPYLGVMLPSTPLHHLLMAELGVPVVATSGNRSDEPICTDEYQALERLAGLADLFLVHNRPIAQHVDDSIVRVVLGRELVLRRARGYAPLPVHSTCTLEQPVLAVGAHQKNTIALAHACEVFVGQHIGDLQTLPAFETFRSVIKHLTGVYDAPPATVACDLHPDYRSTRYAEQLAESQGSTLIRVQHHYAHILACMAENQLGGNALGVAWDGTGYGTDGTIWGGEWLHVTPAGFTRVAWLRPFRLPGGETAIKQPWRAALGLLFEMLGDALWEYEALAPLQECRPEYRAGLRLALTRKLNAPQTSSAGRLFDAIAALIGLRQHAAYEGQPAMELEWAADQDATDAVYPFRLLNQQAGIIVDWEPMVWSILEQVQQHVLPGRVAAMLHNTLAAMIVAVAEQIGEPCIALSGGCFQNAKLLETSVQQLRTAGFRPYWPQRIPPNDGGIALGQAVAAIQYLKNKEHAPCVLQSLGKS